MDNTITLQLTIEQVNAVLQSLSKEPYAAVAALIDNIRTQGMPQAQKIQEAVDEQAS
jgi:hypothetical protein